jgi:S-DNA-T family DNA segregation ATPase FtsK/SpoIIIE
MLKKRKYRKHGPFRMKIKKQTVMTVAAIWMWLIAGTVLLSFFGDGSPVHQLRDELYGQIGWAMYPLPPLLGLLSLQFFKIKSPLAQPNVPLGFAITLAALIPLTQAGVVGEGLMGGLASAASAEVAFLAFLTLFIIGLIIEFNASLDRFMAVVLAAAERMVEWIGRSASQVFAKKSVKPLIPDDGRQLVIKGLDVDKADTKIMPVPAIAPAPAAAKPAPAPGEKKPAPVAAGGKTMEGELKFNAPIAPAEVTQVGEYPPVTLLSEGPKERADRGDMRKNADTIRDTLQSFGVQTQVVEVNPGPAVTQYALRIALGTKLSKITGLSSDLALALAAPTGQVRIEAPIPGRDLVGIEIPNRGLEFVTLKRMLESAQMKKAKSKLTVALGLDVSGNAVVTDIAKMPHSLIAGTTGSGKSVLVNAFITSLLFRTTPQEVRLILVDPKRVELTGYNGIPHLLTPVIVEPDKILSALHWAISEMEHRYKQFAEVGVRNIDGFNELSGFQAMPYIVIIIDELADLMAYAPADVEDSICRLAQMARATGIHLVLATQRPSVDVITGLLKANIPTRIAFNVSSMVDSRVIIDMPGAEKLLGRGDMLFIPPDQSKPSRIQGTFVSEGEVSKVVDFLKTRNSPVQYTQEVTSTPVAAMKKGGAGAKDTGGDGKDQLFEQAIRLICSYDKASASLLQRRLSVGYARAARILDQLEEAGIIGPGEGAKPRDVLVKNADEYFAQQQERGQAEG